MKSRLARFFCTILVIVVSSLGAPAEGARVSLIRDAEIETTIRAYAAPLFAAAGLEASAVKVHLVNDRRLNAFVAGGMQLFLHTGLLLAAESPNQVIGVIAHETGHIAGGHLARTDEVLRNASAATILATVLGVAAVIAGAGEGGAALIVGGQAISRGVFLRYSKSQEQAADQFALTMLDRTGQSARGLLEFLEILDAQAALVASRQDPYVRTHPLGRSRIRHVRNHVAGSPYSDVTGSPEAKEMFRRMQAKLRGCFTPLRQVMTRYPLSDSSLEARYARAMLHGGLSACPGRRPDLQRALGEIDSLIAERPGDAFFLELKGQILFENGRIVEAVDPYRRAVELLPDSPPLRVGLAQALIESGGAGVFAAAAEHLERAVRQDRNDPSVQRLLSIAYARTGRPGLAALASAEQALLTGRYVDAVAFSKRADKLLPFGSPGQLRAQDVQVAAENALKKKSRRGAKSSNFVGR